MIATKTPITPEQLLAMPDSKGLEIVGGKLVENKVGAESSELAGVMLWLLMKYGRELGRVYPQDTAFQCFPHEPTMVRKPDVAFLSYAKWPANRKLGSYIKVAPELAIEVPSPNDVIKELNEKIDDYLRAGVAVVWVINEFGRYVEVHSATAPPQIISGDADLTCEEILPGFRCQVSEIFARIPTED